MLDEFIDPVLVEGYEAMNEYYSTHHKYFVNSQVDALTLTFNIKKDDFDLFKSRCFLRNNEYFVSHTDNSFVARFDKHSYFEVDLAVNKRNNARLDFNPSLISEEVDDFITNTILKDVSKIRISRIDIALDYCLNLSDYSLENIATGLKEREINQKVEFSEIRSSKKILETRYIGSKKNRLYRQYNKKLERKEKAQERVVYEHLWRIEAEVRADRYIDDIRNIFRGLILTNVNFENLDLHDISQEMYKNIFFYLHAENAEQYLDYRTVKKIKEVINNCKTVEDIDLQRDFHLDADELFWGLRKYGVQL